MENLIGIILRFRAYHCCRRMVGGEVAGALVGKAERRTAGGESENERAGMACQELMSLLDRRLYRMQRLLWAATTSNDKEGQIPSSSDVDRSTSTCCSRGMTA